MSQYDLKKLKLLASGGEANIYEIDAHKVLRVIYKKESNNKNTEENVYPLLEKNRINVPQIYEYLTINDQKAQLMERINGKSLLGEWIRHPFAEKSRCMNLQECTLKFFESREAETYRPCRIPCIIL